MKSPYLEVTFRKGRAVAAYLYLPRPPGARAVRTEQAHPTILIDYAISGEPIGLELTAPSQTLAGTVNAVLKELGITALDEQDLAPLRAA